MTMTIDRTSDKIVLLLLDLPGIMAISATAFLNTVALSATVFLNNVAISATAFFNSVTGGVNFF